MYRGEPKSQTLPQEATAQETCIDWMDGLVTERPWIQVTACLSRPTLHPGPIPHSRSWYDPDPPLPDMGTGVEEG